MNNWKRTFAIIWSGQLFSTLSSSIVSYAVVFWLSLQTGSASVLAYAMLASLLPQLVLGLFAGVFVDRWNRKYTMITADIFIALCTAILCWQFYQGAVATWQIYTLLALRSVGSAFHSPAMKASIPLLVPSSELMRVSGFNQMIYSASSIAGPALAALLISVTNMTVVFMFDIVGALIACGTLCFATIPNPEKKEITEHNLWVEIKEGLNAIFAKRGLAWLFVCDVGVMFFLVPISALFPLFTTSYFQGGAYEMSVVETAWGVGMLIGGLLLGIDTMKRFNKVVLIAITCMMVGALFTISGLLSPSAFIIYVIVTAIGGVAVAIWSSAFTVVMQTQIEPNILGRAFAIYDSLSLAPSIPGLLAIGMIADTIGINNAYIYSGIAVCLLGVVLLFIPSTRKMGKMI